MENWEIDFEWLKVRHQVKEMTNKDTLPDLNTILFLIGIQEYGRMKEEFSKEEKQDLMHIAVCEILSYEGYYEFKGRDEEGWPHYDLKIKIPKQNLNEQAIMLKTGVIKYFKNWEDDQPNV